MQRLCRSIAGIALAFLVGCTGDTDVSRGNFSFLRPAPQKVAVAGRSVVIAGPPGYCIDSSATRDSVSGAFVLLGSCASISNNSDAASPATPGLLTASVSSASGTAISRSLGRLKDFFTSEIGKQALARDGRAESVQILGTRQKGDAFYIHARDSSDNAIDGIAKDYWRGLFDVNGRIVTVSVVGFERRPMSSTKGLRTLDAFAQSIRAENVDDATVQAPVFQN